MSALTWTESLNAPTSLATRGETAVVAIEDPGVIELHPPTGEVSARERCNRILGVDLPNAPWEMAEIDGGRCIWVRPGRWRIIGERAPIAELRAALEAEIPLSALTDLTGAITSLRVVGDTANEILARLCPLDLTRIGQGQARGTSVARTKVLLVHEPGSLESWAIHAPRSHAAHVAASLVNAARTPGRLGLFRPAAPPPV